MLEKYKIMGVRMPSKWDIRRVAKLIGATVLPKLTVTTPDEVGLADVVDCEEIAVAEVDIKQCNYPYIISSYAPTLSPIGVLNSFFQFWQRALLISRRNASS